MHHGLSILAITPYGATPNQEDIKNTWDAVLHHYMHNGYIINITVLRF
jgi:hypothetical protein